MSNKLRILAFETSCDDTSVAVFENDTLLAMDTASQIKIHEVTGGVVPEVAAREHANAIYGVLDRALEKSGLTLNDIDYIGVTVTPGLMPSLLTGITVAKTLSNILEIPCLNINHIESHIFANYLERKYEEIEYPLVCLTVSGGHNEIYYMKNMWDFKRLGGTTDDAAGEAFDKVAKMMGLGYPGGPVISKLSEKFSPHPNPLPKGEGIFPRVWLVKRGYDFSFSGLKSAVKREIDKRGELTQQDRIEISYEFQNAVNEVLAFKLINAGEQEGVKTIMLAGGVSANNNLKELIKSKNKNFNFIYPKKIEYSMDNAAMVGILTYYKIKKEIN